MTLLAVSAITGFLFFVPPDSAASGNIKQMLETFLSQKDLKQAPELGWLDDRLDALRLEPAADVRGILPIVLSLLRSENPSHEEIGSAVIIVVALRQDSAQLLGPDIPELVTLLDTHDRTHDGRALGFLALLNPKPPATLVPLLLPRLLDYKLPEAKLLAITSVLLRAAPNDPAVIDAVLNLLQEHPDVVMKCEVIRMIGAAQSVNERTIALLKSALVDTDVNVRLMAVQAVERQPPEVIARFAPQLRKIAADTAEQSFSRESATRALRRLGSQ